MTPTYSSVIQMPVYPARSMHTATMWANTARQCSGLCLCCVLHAAALGEHLCDGAIDCSVSGHAFHSPC